MSRRAVIALEPHDLRARKILLEAQNVFDFRTAPAIDALIVVADAADIATALRDQAQPEILRDVRVLILVDEDVFEALVVIREHVGVLAKEPQRFEQQVAEIDGVENFEALLIEGVERAALAVGETLRFARGHVVRQQAAIFPAVDALRERAGGPAFVVDIFGLQHLLEQPDLVVRVEDREIGLEADKLGVAAQDLRADGVKGAEPLHGLRAFADQHLDALAHLARRLVGEGDGQNFIGARLAEREDMRDARRERARLAGAGAGEHQHRPVQRLDRGALLRVQPVEIARPLRRGGRPRGEPAFLRRVIVKTGQGVAPHDSAGQHIGERKGNHEFAACCREMLGVPARDPPSPGGGGSAQRAGVGWSHASNAGGKSAFLFRAFRRGVTPPRSALRFDPPPQGEGRGALSTQLFGAHPLQHEHPQRRG